MKGFNLEYREASVMDVYERVLAGGVVVERPERRKRRGQDRVRGSAADRVPRNRR